MTGTYDIIVEVDGKTIERCTTANCRYTVIVQYDYSETEFKDSHLYHKLEFLHSFAKNVSLPVNQTCHSMSCEKTALFWSKDVCSHH